MSNESTTFEPPLRLCWLNDDSKLTHEMIATIDYNVCLNRNGYTDRHGKRQVVVELYQQGRRRVINTHIHVAAADFAYGRIQTSHPDYDLLNRRIGRIVRQLMLLEDEMLNADIDPTPQRVADAYLHHQTQTATVSEWVEAIITPSVRRTTTKDNYRVMCRSLEAFHPHITLGELSHDVLERWQNWMRNERHLCQNTISNRLKTLRCLVTEAIKRDVIRADHDPFRHIRIPEITARHEHLTEHELTRLEQATLPSHQLRHVRDAFLFCCYTGLRWSDFRSLTADHLSPTAAGPDILLRQHKTGTPLRIPLAHLWQGKPLALLHRYGTPEHLVDIGDNKTACAQGVCPPVHLRTADVPSLQRLTTALRHAHFAYGAVGGRRGWYAKPLKQKENAPV